MAKGNLNYTDQDYNGNWGTRKLDIIEDPMREGGLIIMDDNGGQIILSEFGVSMLYAYIDKYYPPLLPSVIQIQKEI